MNLLENEVHGVMAAINQAWRTGQPSAMRQYVHPDVVLKLPGFKGEITGREALLSSFEEFCANGRVLEYAESDEQISVIGSCAVVGFHFEMLYERGEYRERSTGRDLWVFERFSDRWLAVWRTMMDLGEVREKQT